MKPNLLVWPWSLSSPTWPDTERRVQWPDGHDDGITRADFA